MQLEDDPAFTIDSALPPLDFDEALLELSTLADAGLDSAQATPLEGKRKSGPTISLPYTSGQSSSNTGSAFRPLYAPSHSSLGNNSSFLSISVGPGERPSFGDDEEFLADIDVEFDEEGNLREVPDQNTAQQTGRELITTFDGPLVSSGRGEGADHLYLQSDGVNGSHSNDQDQEALLDGTRPAENIVPSSVDQDPPIIGHLPLPEQISVSFDTPAIAPLRTRIVRTRQPYGIEGLVEISRHVLQLNNQRYVSNMEDQSATLAERSSRSAAKKLLSAFIPGSGIGLAGIGVGCDHIINPAFASFAGVNLTGWMNSFAQPFAYHPPQEGLIDQSFNGNQLLELRPGHGRLQDGSILPHGEESIVIDTNYLDTTFPELEVGREPATPLADRDSLMPWNSSTFLRSSALRGSRQSSIGGGTFAGFGTSSGIGFEPGTVRERGGISGLRSGSPSPTLGRSRPRVTAGLGRTSSNTVAESLGEEDDMLMNENFEDLNMLGDEARDLSERQRSDVQILSTQYDQQTENFFEFVMMSSKEQGRRQAPGGNGAPLHAIIFQELFLASETNVAVAAQAFMHMLTLATRGSLQLQQDGDRWDGEIDILLST